MWNKKRMLVGILGIILVLNGCSYLPKSNKDLSSVGQHKIVEEESQREEQDIEEWPKHSLIIYNRITTK